MDHASKERTPQPTHQSPTERSHTAPSRSAWALQRHLGNQAFTRLLQRDPTATSEQSQADSDLAVTFKADDGEHRLWVEEGEAGPVVMMASDPQTLYNRLSLWRSVLEKHQLSNPLKLELQAVQAGLDTINATIKLRDQALGNILAVQHYNQLIMTTLTNISGKLPTIINMCWPILQPQAQRKDDKIGQIIRQVALEILDHADVKEEAKRMHSQHNFSFTGKHQLLHHQVESKEGVPAAVNFQRQREAETLPTPGFWSDKNAPIETFVSGGNTSTIVEEKVAVRYNNAYGQKVRGGQADELRGAAKYASLVEFPEGQKGDYPALAEGINGIVKQIIAKSAQPLNQQQAEQKIASALELLVQTGEVPDDLRDHEAFLRDLMQLLFIREPTRMVAALTTAPMMIELIKGGKLSWREALSSPAKTNNSGGGLYQPTFQNAMGAARGLDKEFGIPVPPEGAQSTGSTADREEMLSREREMVLRWLEMKMETDVALLAQVAQDADGRKTKAIIKQAILSFYKLS